MPRTDRKHGGEYRWANLRGWLQANFGGFRDQIGKLAESLRPILREVRSVVKLVEALNARAQKDGGGVTLAGVTNVVRATLSLVRTITSTLGPADGAALTAFATLDAFLKDALAVSEAIAERAWARVGATTLRLVRHITSKLQITNPFANEKINRALQFASVLSDIATAKDDKAIQDIIARAADPVGGWRSKRSARQVLSIASFPGVIAGNEWVMDKDVNAAVDSGAVVAPFVPLGLDWSFVGGKAGSFGLFFPVIDLGNLVTARVENTEGTGDDGMKDIAEPIAEPTFVQLLSLGAFLRWGLFRTPLVIGAGFTWAPEGRLVSIDDGAAEMRAPTIRFMVYASIDVTLFAF